MTGPIQRIDAQAIREALPPIDAVEAIRDALVAGFDPASASARTVVPTTAGQFLLMPSEVGAFAGVKVATVAPGNPARGLPRIQAGYLLFDAETLTLRAELDGTALTALRTPAVSIAALLPAVQRLVGGSPRIVVFGAGPQAVGHVEMITAVLNGEVGDVSFVVRSPFQAAASGTLSGSVLRAGSGEASAALGAADIVVCATTAREPLFDSREVHPDALVVAVGSHEPDARELDSALLARAQVIVEDRATALREAGDIIMAIAEDALERDSLLDMRSVVIGSQALPDNGPVVFKSTGMAWQDLVIATAVFERIG